MPNAPAPKRQTDGLTLSLGLMLIPIATYTATEEGGITRATFHKGTDNRVGIQKVDKVTGEVLSNEDCDMRIETQYGHVFVEDHDIEALFSLDPQQMKVLEFQPRHLWDQGHYVPKKLAYIGPGKTKVGSRSAQVLPVTERALATFLQAMESRNAMALVEITTRGKPKPALLFPDGRLWYIHHTEEVREQPPLPDVETVPAEVAMAGGLVDAMFSTEVRDIKDERTALILAHAEEKASKGDFTRSEEPEAVEKPAPDQDAFMAMLQASIDAAKAQKAQAS